MTKSEKVARRNPKEICAQNRKSGLTKHSRFGNRKFWAEGCCVSTVGLNGSTIRKCIREQEGADIALDRLGVKEYEDPFAGR